MSIDKSKIKISFFSPAAYPIFTDDKRYIHGGAELQMFFMATELAKNENFEISFIVGNYYQKKVVYINNVKLLRAFKLTHFEPLISKFLKSIQYVLILIKENPEIIFTTSAHATVGISYLYSKIFRKKHIHRTANLYDIDYSWINKNGLAGKIYKYGLENSHISITQNIEYKELLKKNHKKDSFVLKNSFKINGIMKQKKEYFLWVGRFVDWKKPEIYFDIAKQLTHIKFVMICPYSDKNKVEWENFKLSCQTISNLSFIEKVAFSEIQEYFNKAIAFINTSDYEGFPNTFIQSGIGKTPIISLKINPDNFIEENNCGYFCNGNTDTMKNNIKLLYTNNILREEKGENALSYVKENHSIEKNIIVLKKIISQI